MDCDAARRDGRSGLSKHRAGGLAAPVVISPKTGAGSYVQVAIDGRGDVTAVWQELQGPSPVDYAVMSSSRSAATERWTRPVTISKRGHASLFPGLAVDPEGAAVLVWESGEFSDSRTATRPSVQASFRASPTGAWTRPARLSAAGVDTAMPTVGIDAHGNAVAMWFTDQPNIDRIEAASGSVRTGRWSTPVQLAAGGPQRLINPQIAVNARGEAVATWEIWTAGGPVDPNGQTNTVVAAVKPPRHTWLAPVNLGIETDLTGQASASFEFPGPQVALDARGDAIIVWQAKGRKALIPEASFSQPSGTWSTPAPISNTPALSPQVAMDARGDATVVWDGPNGSVVTAAKTATAHRWSASRTLARGAPLINPYPQVAIDQHGDAVATWTGKPTEAAVRHGRTGRWQHAVKLGQGGVSHVAVGRSGRAIVAWQLPTDHSIRIVAARYVP